MNRVQEKAPLFEGLLEHINKDPLQFHIPGHKKGAGMDPDFRDFVGANVLKMDLINIAPLDDLHHPKKIIDEAQQLAAEAFGADHTFFSVQGTSGAIITMIMSVCGPGDKIIVPRNVHKSIMSAVIFAGARPVFVHPEIDQEFGISHGISLEAAERALEAHPDAKAFLVINPTYFGVAADLKGIVEAAHKQAVPVLVDEAHGVHTHFHDDLPLSAMQAGADMAATSVHKLGGSLTQSSVLNVQGSLVHPARVQSVISMLTTTSTSYILLASLDTARRHLAVNGRNEIERTLKLSGRLRQQINDIPGLSAPGKEILNHKSRYDMDTTKVMISVKELRITGYDAEVWLRENENIEVELSDLYNILVIITPADSADTISRLGSALENLSRKMLPSRTWVDNGAEVEVPSIPVLAYSPRDAFYAETEEIPLVDSAGRVSAEFLMIYPPGIPVFIPGEIIEKENLHYIRKNMESGLPVQGLEDKSLTMIRVIRESRPIR
ncbi:aminotransferase class I/II-fold pyridoxal phosphate-dependent enzyme [Alkalicoccus luteus]|uniref:Aminotransferase class I/II-fold pyridoxal phosphate-dependent enzyme n=1 Tax=Alkalicoccus luteus TaxID=1237094 RepID=A0A969PVM2_9BACI|nr:aminotransferase class I/II-fold pyridoxal phosphate-dependent enzyme [Alkalicoccus luteus]NJP39196.1 aminotransferase class I/II-fold pyridoxal phosphate-dependent enzyme [Alkalicoccus luteus]